MVCARQTHVTKLYLINCTAVKKEALLLLEQETRKWFEREWQLTNLHNLNPYAKEKWCALALLCVDYAMNSKKKGVLWLCNMLITQ